jgi:two-component system, OmpR family, alkaline phosphatase synthesis response regulator PhoP
MSKASILVVDDEEDILEIIRYNLSRDGYEVTCAASGEEALKLIRNRPPHVVILDLMLPGVDGLDVCRQVKAATDTAHIPIIMLTARSEDADVVAGLEIGADDYITKPFSPRVLSARVKAVLRRKKSQDSDPATLIFDDLALSPERHSVTVKGIPVDLTATEFRILHTLARRPGWVFSREQIVDATQGTNTAVTNRSVDVHIVSLRRKLGTAGELVETMRGVGYRFRDPRNA